MGLTATTESGATLWDGPYGGFMNWRNTIALAAGYSIEEDTSEEGITLPCPVLDWDSITSDNMQGDWESIPEDPLVILLAHHDHEGHLYPEHAALIADRLEAVAPGLKHIRHDMYWMETRTQKAIAALRSAARDHEVMKFR